MNSPRLSYPLAALSLLLALFFAFAAARASFDQALGNPHWPRPFPFPDRAVIWLYVNTTQREFTFPLDSDEVRTQPPGGPLWRRVTPASDLLEVRLLFAAGAAAMFILAAALFYRTAGRAPR